MKNYVDFELAERNVSKRRYVRTQKEVAEILGVSYGTLYNMQRYGTIPLLIDYPRNNFQVVKLTKSYEWEGKIRYTKTKYYDVRAILEALKANKQK